MSTENSEQYKVIVSVLFTYKEQTLHKMRPLTDEETKVLFTKLGEYIGDNIKYLIERTDEPYVFRLIKCKVYYMSESLMKLAQNVGKENLVHVGTCFGKFTNGGKFRVNVTCLDYLAKYAKNKVWLKP